MEDIRAPTDAELKRLAKALVTLPLFVGGGDAQLQVQRWKSWQDRGNKVLAAFQGPDPVGVCLFMTRGTFSIGAYLTLMAVTAAAQGKGVGSRMLAAYEAACAEQARGGWFILTKSDNELAQRFYKRNGYSHVGTLPGFQGPGETDFIFWKPNPENKG